VITRMSTWLRRLNRVLPQSMPGWFAAVVVLLQFVSPRLAMAQSGAADAIRWRGSVKYSEVATSPDGHRVKNIEASFELVTPLRGPQDFSQGTVETWQNVVVAWADSGRWHYDEQEVEGGRAPETDGQWDVSDRFAVPSGVIERLTPRELHTDNSDGSVQEVQLPTLPVQQVGSKVLVQPNGIGLRLDVTYRRGMATFYPKTGSHDRLDLQVLIFAKQPAHAAGEGIAVDDKTPDEYAGLPPEIIASLKMADAAIANAGDESEDDQMSIMALKMDGFVDYDGDTVSGSRTWTTTSDDPGEYTSSNMDDQTTVSHELVWSFVPVKGK